MGLRQDISYAVSSLETLMVSVQRLCKVAVEKNDVNGHIRWPAVVSDDNNSGSAGGGFISLDFSEQKSGFELSTYRGHNYSTVSACPPYCLL